MTTKGLTPKPKKSRNKVLASKNPLLELSTQKITGIFNGFNIIVADPNCVQVLTKPSSGHFGKLFSNIKETMIRRRQFTTRKTWGKHSKIPRQVLIAPDSDEDDTYFENELLIQYEIDDSGLVDTLYLILEESFFLHHMLNALDIRKSTESDVNFDTAELWHTFVNCDPLFPEKYAVYSYYRAKNWVVTDGTKFGGDYLLYKQGPGYYHSSYVVLLVNSDSDMDTLTVKRLSRLCETFTKELLLCRVIWTENKVHFETAISNCQIEETLLKRWLYKHELN